MDSQTPLETPFELHEQPQQQPGCPADTATDLPEHPRPFVHHYRSVSENPNAVNWNSSQVSLESSDSNSRIFVHTDSQKSLEQLFDLSQARPSIPLRARPGLPNSFFKAHTRSTSFQQPIPTTRNHHTRTQSSMPVPSFDHSSQLPLVHDQNVNHTIVHPNNVILNNNNNNNTNNNSTNSNHNHSHIHSHSHSHSHSRTHSLNHQMPVAQKPQLPTMQANPQIHPQAQPMHAQPIQAQPHIQPQPQISQPLPQQPIYANVANHVDIHNHSHHHPVVQRPVQVGHNHLHGQQPMAGSMMHQSAELVHSHNHNPQQAVYANGQHDHFHHHAVPQRPVQMINHHHVHNSQNHIVHVHQPQPVYTNGHHEHYNHYQHHGVGQRPVQMMTHHHSHNLHNHQINNLHHH